MVIFPNDLLAIYTRGTITHDNEGNATGYTYAYVKSVVADVQPLTFQMASPSLWGLTDIDSDSKIVTVDVDTIFQEPLKIIDRAGKAWELRGVNPWPNHYNLLLVPFQGGQTQ